MQPLEKSQVNSYDISNYFGFCENDTDISFCEKSSVMSGSSAPLQFQTNKPYRLALYVRPSEQKRLQRTKAPCLVRNTTEKPASSKKNDSINSTRLSKRRQAKTSSKVDKKASVMLFDENVGTESVSKKFKKTPQKTVEVNDVSVNVSSVRKSVLKEVNTKPVTKTKQNKTRRSYERKFKKEETENIPEPPSDEIIKELEFKKLSKTKQKKTAKEEQEFEKWANSINSDFNDVDKFELSIAYD